MAQENTTIKRAALDHPIQPLLAERFSPYSFSPQPVSAEELTSLFEAARWAASSYNDQPWRYIVATKADAAEFARVLSCLVDANQAWAKEASVLALGCVMKNLSHGGKPNPVAIHDLGAASANLCVEATARGLHVHQMVGILPDKAREIFHIPDDAIAVTGLAIGHAGINPAIPDAVAQRDQKPRERKKLAEIVFTGDWKKPAPL